MIQCTCSYAARTNRYQHHNAEGLLRNNNICGCGLQAGTYRLSVAPPDVNTGSYTPVLGSPLNITVLAGPADAAHCSAAVTAPPYPVVGSNVSINVTLADAYGNPVPGSSTVQQNTTLTLVVYGESSSMQCVS